MNHSLKLICIALSCIFAWFFLAEDSFASPCTWWSSTNCTDPSRIQVCADGSCTITGGVRAVDSAVGTNLSRMTISNYIVTVVRYFLGFVTLISVAYIMYAGFRLMTSGGDEEQSKKARKIIIYVIIGILIMWSAYWIVRAIIGALDRPLAVESVQIHSTQISYI